MLFAYLIIRYGDGIGLYRSHLFGSPAIIACSPMVNKFVLQSDSNFILEWPTVELVGTTSLVAVHGEGHTRLRIFVQRAVNQPEALSRIALMLQPRLIAALQSWAQRGTIVGFKEAKKVPTYLLIHYIQARRLFLVLINFI